MDTSITINFADKSPVDVLRDLLIIEQKEWVNTIGKVKMSDFYSFAYHILDSSAYESAVNCGLNADGTCTSLIYVYPKVIDLSYQMHTSYGTLSDRVIDDFLHQELINFSIAKKASLTYSPFGRVSYSWLGSVYDSAGNIRSAPSVGIDSLGNIILSENVYGTLKVEYTLRRHIYSLNVAPRESGIDMFGAVVYGLYTEGLSWLELNNPPDVDELTEGSMTCGGMTYNMSDEYDPNKPDEAPIDAPEVNRRIVYDYCSQVLISDETTYNGIMPGQG